MSIGYRPPQYRRGLKLPEIFKAPAAIGYRPPQYRRGLKLTEAGRELLAKDIDHPNIEGD